MPIPTEKVAGTYLRGIATVKIRDDAELLIQFENDDQVFALPYDMSSMGDIVSGKYRVSLSSDGSKLFSIVPESGTFIVRYDSMVSQEGQLPTPKFIPGGQRQSKDGKKKWTAPDSLAFTPLLRIVSAPNKRLKIPLQLVYSFVQYKDTNETQIPLGYKNLEKTAEFLQVAGFDFAVDSIPWSDNVLPFIDEFIRDKNVKFQCILKNGYVDSVAKLPELDDD